MKVVGLALGAAGALLVGALVWASVAADAAALWDGAGWWSLLALLFPAFIGYGAWRG